MDAIEAITQDHRRMEQLFGQLEAGDGDRRALIDEVAARLEAHSHAEEREVYPAIKKAAPDEADEVEHSYDEHAEAESLLHKVQSLVDSPDFDDALQEFLEAVRHHVEEEESSLLPALREAADDAELDRLGEAFEEARLAELGETGHSADLEEMTRAELYEEARKADVPGRSHMTKDELKDALQHA